MRDNEKYSDIQLFHFDNAKEVRQTGACYRKNYFIVNPLAYWSNEYLWNYIESEHIEVNPLYGEGFTRVGCIGCPMAGRHRIEEFKRYPKYKSRFIKLCDDIIFLRNKEKLPNKYKFKDGKEYFEYWLNEKISNLEEL